MNRIPPTVAAAMHSPGWCDLRPDQLHDSDIEVTVDHRTVVGTVLADDAHWPGDVRRARLLSVHGRPVPVVERVDHLADIAAVMASSKRMRTMEILWLLGKRNRAVYGSWHADKLKAALEAEGIRTVRVDGIVHVRAADVHERLADRLLDTDGDEQGAE